MRHRREFEDCIEHYALGTLEGEELRDFEHHLNTGCNICEGALMETQRVLALIPYSLSDHKLSPKAKEKLFEIIDESEAINAKTKDLAMLDRFGPLWLKLAGSLAVGLIVLLTFSNWYLWSRLSAKNRYISELRQQPMSDKELMEFMENPNVEVVNLEAAMPDLRAHGKVFWNKSDRVALLYAMDLPETSKGKTYQCWVMENDKPVSRGMFKVGEDGKSMMKLKLMAELNEHEKFFVTLEPEGGMPYPTGEMYLVGYL